MKRTFASEDKRKNKLFEAWNGYLQATPISLNQKDNFDELFEGIVTVTDVSANYLSVHLEDESNVHKIPINIKISFHSLRHDEMFMVLGLTKEGKWWPLDVTSIGSAFDHRHNTCNSHVTINPLLMEAFSKSMTEELRQ